MLNTAVVEIKAFPSSFSSVSTLQLRPYSGHDPGLFRFD